MARRHAEWHVERGRRLRDAQLDGARVENNIPPTVTITTAPTRGNVYQATPFVATANDPDGTIVRYEWDWTTTAHSVSPRP